MESSSELFVAPEDAVQALIDHFVLPLLPRKVSPKDSPSLALQQCVAEQMHAVVLLYNYFHRKQFPQLEFLGLESFCKIATIARPSLIVFMKFMLRFEEKSYNLEKQLSITEKMVLKACNICTRLDISKDSPSMGNWPVSKVAVLLINPTKRNCLLQFSITQGVWSLVEKEIGNRVGAPPIHITCDKRRSANGLSRDELPPHEDVFQQLAFSAVKEKSGINGADLIVLESHIIYSLSREKTTARFYLMQYKQVVNEEMTEICIKDVMDSLQGPLVRKDHTVTPVVKYFHLLPYVDILSDWLSRKNLQDGLFSTKREQANLGDSDPLVPKRTLTPGDSEINEMSSWTGLTLDSMDKKISSGKFEIINGKENGSCSLTKSSKALYGPRKEATGSSLNCHQQGLPDKDKNKIVENVTADKHLDQTGSSIPGALFEDKADMADPVNKSCISMLIDARPLTRIDSCNAGLSVQGIRPAIDLPLDPIQTQSSETFQLVMESKKSDISVASCAVLQKKRAELCHKQRLLDDEIAQCEMNLQMILSEDSMMLNIDSIIEACNTLSSIGEQMGEPEFFRDQSPHPKFRRKRLSEAVLTLWTPCQELGNICRENNWISPIYNVLPLCTDGGFHAEVRVQGPDFETTTDGDPSSSPQEARESAAAHMLAKLRSMASEAQ